MALDDRDRSFEKALARRLRYIAPDSAEPDALVSVPCPDAEILAAYHDGSLGSEELAIWKQHVVSCERCQIVLEHLATPLDVPAGQQSAEKIPAAPVRQSEPPQPQAAASSPRVASPAPVIAIRPRKMYLRWLVPAGAIAAVLLGMVVVENSRSIFRRAPAEIETANNRQPTAATSPASRSAAAEVDALRTKQPPAKEAFEEKDKALGASSGTPSGGLPRSAAEPKQQREQAPSAQNAYAQYSAHGPKLSQQEQQRQTASGFGEGRGTGQALDKKKDESQAVPGTTDGQRDLAAKKVPAAPPPAPSIAENQPAFLEDDSINRRSAATAPAAPKPAAAAKARAGVSGATAPGAASETVTVESSAAALMAVRGDAISSGPIVRAPSSDVAWRVGAAGSIEHSTDGGVTWSPQPSGIISNLTTGYALSAKVCWVVGASGIILRTTDGGAHWIKISSPVAADLISVRSSDAFHATIWFIDDPATGSVKSFKTSDGGIHWSPVSND